MPSGNFHSIPIDSITKGDRQRKELKDVQVLADSINRLGLIHPIVVTRDGKLIAGERRLESAKLLKWTHINVQYAEDLDPATLHAIELEENVKRVDLPWQDQTRAIQKYHEFRKAEPGWTASKTAEALGLSLGSISQHLQVATSLDKPEVAKAEKFSVARGLVERTQSRLRDSFVVPVEPSHAVLPSKSTILNADFLEWAPSYTGSKFNLIHCDFPYGLNMHSADLGHSTSRELEGGYDDSLDTYRALCRCFADNCNRFCSSSAHLVFWFSPKEWEWTKEFLENETPFTIDPFPLVWHKSDNAGLLPDPQRGPRRTYEIAFYGIRGDRKVVRPVSNSFSGPTVPGHMSEKPQAMLTHFFRMLVDESTTLFDPTCGSGSSLRAGLALGAQSVLGLEILPDFAARAQARMKEDIII